MKYLLDTNICIYMIKQHCVEVIEKVKTLPLTALGISSITVAELEYGVAKSIKIEQNQKALLQFLSPLAILPFDSAAAEIYGHIRAILEKKGTPIGPMDLLIAAHALSEKRTLVTNNTKEFLRVPDLKVENWVSL